MACYLLLTTPCSLLSTSNFLLTTYLHCTAKLGGFFQPSILSSAHFHNWLLFPQWRREALGSQKGMSLQKKDKATYDMETKKYREGGEGGGGGGRGRGGVRLDRSKIRPGDRALTQTRHSLTKNYITKNQLPKTRRAPGPADSSDS